MACIAACCTAVAARWFMVCLCVFCCGNPRILHFFGQLSKFLKIRAETLSSIALTAMLYFYADFNCFTCTFKTIPLRSGSWPIRQIPIKIIRKNMSALVIKEWKADQKPVDSANNYVSITGRKGGLVAWLLSLVKIDPTTTIRVSAERLEFASGSIEGNDARIIPLQNICSSYYGYHKPWKSAAGIFGFFLFLHSRC
jgi:hypothetical protein